MGVDFFLARLELGVLAIQISTSVWRIVPNTRRWMMDTLGLDGTVNAFHRVLKSNGVDIFIFSHPC